MFRNFMVTTFVFVGYIGVPFAMASSSFFHFLPTLFPCCPFSSFCLYGRAVAKICAPITVVGPCNALLLQMIPKRSCVRDCHT